MLLLLLELRPVLPVLLLPVRRDDLLMTGLDSIDSSWPKAEKESEVAAASSSVSLIDT